MFYYSIVVEPSYSNFFIFIEDITNGLWDISSAHTLYILVSIQSGENLQETSTNAQYAAKRSVESD
jgi:hypothetical protein